MDRNAELRRLAEADGHIAEAERHVSEQRIQVEKLGREGHDTSLALALLTQFEGTLATLRGNRDLIIQTIAEIDQGKI